MQRANVVQFISWCACLVVGLLSLTANAYSAGFQIVWVVVGDAVSSAGDQPTKAGKHLFMASDIAEMSLAQVSVNGLNVQPTVSSLVVGQSFCFTSLRIAATGKDRSLVKHAPLSVSVRQDHRDALQLQTRKQDICVRPSTAGEYPIRFTSLIPAPDGGMRTAQVFLRVQEATASDVP
jgi:hypothetical protein